jgi:putative transposase
LIIKIAKDTVRRVLTNHYEPAPGSNGPSWLTLLGHSKDSLWSVDLFRCESLTLTSHWVMVVMDQFNRRIIGVAVHKKAPDGPDVCRMFNGIISGSENPQYLSSDNDPLFRYRQWQANLRILQVTEVKTIPYVPLSHPFVERLIGTIRREYLDHVPFWTTRDLERKLLLFQEYYNKVRPHQGLDGALPNMKGKSTEPKIVNLKTGRWKSHCHGLYQLPEAA